MQTFGTFLEFLNSSHINYFLFTMKKTRCTSFSIYVEKNIHLDFSFYRVSRDIQAYNFSENSEIFVSLQNLSIS